MVTLNAGCGAEPAREEIAQAIVEGGSMAPTLHGSSLMTTCPNCQFEFQTDQIQTPHYRWLYCPNCPTDKISLDDSSVIEADSCSVFAASHPKRWEMVAFRFPGNDRLGIKRVVGLPGELIRIEDGEVFAGQKLVRKSLKQIRKQAIKVYDSNSFDRTAARGFPAAKENRGGPWKQASTIAFSPQNANGPEAEQELQWIAYEHARGNRQHHSREEQESECTLISDGYAYNQTDRRPLNRTEEFLLTLDCEVGPEANVGLRLSRRAGVIQVVIDNGRLSLTVSQNGKPIESVKLANRLEHFRWEISTVDSVLAVAIGGEEMIRFEIPPATEGRRWPDRQIELGARADNVVVNQLVISRDIYYYSRRGKAAEDVGQKGTEAASEIKLADDEYFVIGDNVPVSVDSRSWARPGLKRSRIIGVVEKTSQRSNNSKME